jgi:hypothetical protein
MCEGGILEPEHAVSFFAVYQFIASGLLIGWALMLFFASWPFRRFVVRGSVDQWMSFGADLGVENMSGASSSLRGSGSNTIWILNSTLNGDGVGRLGLYPVARAGNDQKRLRVDLGVNYT